MVGRLDEIIIAPIVALLLVGILTVASDSLSSLFANAHTVVGRDDLVGRLWMMCIQPPGAVGNFVVDHANVGKCLPHDSVT